MMKELNPGRREVVRLISDAARDSRTISILIKGETGVATIKIQNDTVARFRDVYSMLQELMPELTKEFA